MICPNGHGVFDICTAIKQEGRWHCPKCFTPLNTEQLVESEKKMEKQVQTIYGRMSHEEFQRIYKEKEEQKRKKKRG